MVQTAVTGATGFLGRHLCALLRQDGHEVRAVVRTRQAALDALGVTQVEGDVLDAASLPLAFKGAQVVFHLAGRVSRNPDDASALHRLHVGGTQHAVDACLQAGVPRMVHCSTSGTVGVTASPGYELDEEAQPDLTVVGRWPYYLSKLYAEQTALRANSSKLAVVSINPSLLLGPGDERGDSVRDVRLFMERKIPGAPSGGVSLVDVRDAAAALVAGWHKGRPGERYLVTGLNCTVREFFERLSRVTEVPAPLFTMSPTVGRLSSRMMDAVARGLDTANPLDETTVEMAGWCWYVSAEKAQRQLGINLRDMGQTLHDTVEDLRRRGVTTQGSMPNGAGLVEAMVADGFKALDRWRRKMGVGV